MPDGWFYYSVTIALAAAVIGILYRYSSKIDRVLESLSTTVHELVTITKLHELKHEQHDKDIEELKNGNYLIKYKK